MSNRSIGGVLLCLLLILGGLSVVFGLNLGPVMPLVGVAMIAAGILILVGR